jgi:dihydroorotase
MKNSALLLKGCRVFDLEKGLSGITDISFKREVTAEDGDENKPNSTQTLLNCSDLIVTPGLIDIHVHAFKGGSDFGLEADKHFFYKGIFTAVDAGSAGACNIDQFISNVIHKSKTRLFAFINVAVHGLIRKGVAELRSPGDLNFSKTVDLINKNRETILGIKVRLSQKAVDEQLGIIPLIEASRISNETGLPIMVHGQSAWCDSIDDILKYLKKGDMLTHCFHDQNCGVLNQTGKVLDSVIKAKECGVIFDVGHGKNSFSFDIAEKAIDQGLLPYTISSDLHTYNYQGPVFDLLTTMNKFLCLGLSLDQIIKMTITHPANLIGRNKVNISPITSETENALVLKIEKGNFNFTDSKGNTRRGSRRLIPEFLIADGKLHKIESKL